MRPPLEATSVLLVVLLAFIVFLVLRYFDK